MMIMTMMIVMIMMVMMMMMVVVVVVVVVVVIMMTEDTFPIFAVKRTAIYISPKSHIEIEALTQRFLPILLE